MTPQQARTMSAYNHWMNDKLYAVCADLPDAARREDRGAFFRSVHGTLNHLLLADRVWLGRFTGNPYAVNGLDQELYADFGELRSQRSITDADIVDWADGLTGEALAAAFEFRGIANRKSRTLPLWVCVTHFFNHQAHHRGQLTTLLAQAGLDYGVTDLLWMPDVGTGQ